MGTKYAYEWGREKARENRKKQTPAEIRFKEDADEMGFKVSVQKQIVITINPREKHIYIADFRGKNQYKKHIIEIDGEYHNTPEQMEKDAIRTKHLETRGYIVHRISNSDVFEGKGKELIKEIIDSEA